MPPSLHAGLIERGRPRSISPPPAPGLKSQESPEPLSVLTPVKPRRSTPTPPVQVPNIVRIPELGRRRRFGLTVRVSCETRELLDQLRARTGQTFQQILHSAVTAHIARS